MKQRAWLDGLKMRSCMDCQQSFPPECMQFDHVRGKKLFTIGEKAMQNTPGNRRVLAEIAKCDLVCANCHAIRTKRRQCHSQAH